jgi:hypothetical protein
MCVARKLLCTLLFVLYVPAMAQSSYDAELSQLSAGLRALMTRAERNQPMDVSGRAEIQRDLFELSKALHRLEEEAMGANLELQRKGGSPDRQILLSAAVAKALDLAQSLTSYYLDIQEKALWVSAVSAAQSARSLQAAR